MEHFASYGREKVFCGDDFSWNREKPQMIREKLLMEFGVFRIFAAKKGRAGQKAMSFSFLFNFPSSTL